ncbi:MAG: SRPBCC domain-containing protein [Candidatus Eiseniibacteriota bacterium]
MSGSKGAAPVAAGTGGSVGFSVHATIERPIEEVFDHVVEPGLLSSYFTATASEALAPGQSIRWTWKGGQAETVHVDEVERNARIVLHWKADQVEYDTRVTLTFTAESPAKTKVEIAETGWKNDAAGLASAFGHCSGWQHMLLSLRARMMFGVDLRG